MVSGYGVVYYGGGGSFIKVGIRSASRGGRGGVVVSGYSVAGFNGFKVFFGSGVSNVSKHVIGGVFRGYNGGVGGGSLDGGVRCGRGVCGS